MVVGRRGDEQAHGRFGSSNQSVSYAIVMRNSMMLTFTGAGNILLEEDCDPAYEGYLFFGCEYDWYGYRMMHVLISLVL